jgi:RNase P subunit RPR2
MFKHYGTFTVESEYVVVVCENCGEQSRVLVSREVCLNGRTPSSTDIDPHSCPKCDTEFDTWELAQKAGF